MRRYVGYALITIAILTGIVWGISQFIQPILPTYFNNNLILVIGILIGVVGLLAQLKDVVELFRPDSESTKQKVNRQRNDFSITGPVQINYGNVTNVTLNITYLVPSQDKSFMPLSDTRTERQLQEGVIPIPRQIPPPPREFIGRYQEITVLKQILLTQSNKATVTGLIGMGGIGKTTLVSALANDPEVEGAFPDGTLWTSLYESNQTKTILIDWIRALGYSRAVENLEENQLFDVFRNLVRKRRLLIIVDGADKNRVSNLNIFLKTLENAMAPESRMLITSREINLPGAQTLVSLDLLPETEAVELLERNIGRTFTSDEKTIASEIVFLLGYHPLAITIAAARFRLSQVRLAFFRDKLRSTKMSFDLDEIRSTVIQSTLDLSFNSLTRSEQSRLRALSVFASDETFDHIAASFVWHTSYRTAKSTLSKFSRQSLVVTNEKGYNLHPLIRSYLKELVAKETLKKVQEMAQQGYIEYLKIKNAKGRK